MSAKNWTIAGVGVVLAAGIAGTTVLGVQIHERYQDLEHGDPFVLEEPEPIAAPAGATVAEVDQDLLRQRLDQAADNPALGTLHGVATDITTGQRVWERNPDEPLTPASATKVLTSAAAMLAMDPGKRLVTEVVTSDNPGTVVIVASGDVWLTPDRLDELAEELTATGQQFTEVVIDTSAWQGTEYVEDWDPGNVDGGYVAPLQPAMVHQGRIGADSGDVPRSHTPAFDVAAALADRIGAETVGVGPAPETSETLASTESEPLVTRMNEMMLWSDNVMAEAIGRELAIDRNAEPTVEGATQATLDTLAEAGFNVDGTELHDNSGLSASNNIRPSLINDIIAAGATGERLRPLLDTLPVAFGEGTLFQRFEDQAGRGWVRAKTGTLTGVNALAGTVTADSGRVYAFTLLSNDGGGTLEARRGLDEIASVLRED